MRRLLFIFLFIFVSLKNFSQNEIKTNVSLIDIKSLKEEKNNTQPPAINTSNIVGEFEKIDTTNISKDKMWINLKKWISLSFKDYKYVVDLEDKEAGTLIIKWTSLFYPQSSRFLKCTVNSSFQIDVRENKYRVKIYDGLVKVTPYMEENVKNLSTESLLKAKDDLTIVMNISASYFNSSPNWSINKQYNYAKENSTDKAKPILSDILNSYTSICSKLYESLHKDIIAKDDF